METFSKAYLVTDKMVVKFPKVVDIYLFQNCRFSEMKSVFTHLSMETVSRSIEKLKLIENVRDNNKSECNVNNIFFHLLFSQDADNSTDAKGNEVVPNLPPPKVQKVDLAALFTARQLPMSDNECVSTSTIYIRSVSTQLLRDIKYVELVQYSCLMILKKLFVDF